MFVANDCIWLISTDRVTEYYTTLKLVRGRVTGTPGFDPW